MKKLRLQNVKKKIKVDSFAYFGVAHNAERSFYHYKTLVCMWYPVFFYTLRTDVACHVVLHSHRT